MSFMLCLDWVEAPHISLNGLDGGVLSFGSMLERVEGIHLSFGEAEDLALLTSGSVR